MRRLGEPIELKTDRRGIWEPWLQGTWRGSKQKLISGQKRGITTRRLERSLKRLQMVELVITPPFQKTQPGSRQLRAVEGIDFFADVKWESISSIKNYVAEPRGQMLETLADIEFIKNRTGFCL